MLLAIKSIFAAKERVYIRFMGYLHNSDFQFSSQRAISELGLLGWMRVSSNQGVEIEVEGPRPKLDALVDKLKVLATRARLSSMAVSWKPFTGTLNDFRVRNN